MTSAIQRALDETEDEDMHAVSSSFEVDEDMHAVFSSFEVDDDMTSNEYIYLLALVDSALSSVASSAIGRHCCITMSSLEIVWSSLGRRRRGDSIMSDSDELHD